MGSTPTLFRHLALNVASAEHASMETVIRQAGPRTVATRTELIGEASLYEADFFTWSERQAALLRQGRFDAFDLENVAEDIASQGRSQAASLESAFRLICRHQLKRLVQPERAGRSWAVTIGRERLRATRLLRQNPGLKPHRASLFGDAYRDARAEAALETGKPIVAFPEEPPFTLEQIMDPEFWAGPTL